MALLILSSLFLLVRGHNEPGGGFAGGLVASGALALHVLVYGAGPSRRVLRVDPRDLIGIGLLVAVISAAASLIPGEPFMTGQWSGLFGTPIMFDVGVYAVVAGVTLTIISTMEESA
jgi:multisubunit Na+/H+ antiporter MnhB subunit